MNQNLTQAAPILSSNSYLQLPNQTDSFRRAHSDSSIHNSIVNQPQMPNYHNNPQHQMPNHMPNQQNFHNNNNRNVNLQQNHHVNFSHQQQQQQHAYQQNQNQYHQTNSTNYQNNHVDNFIQQNINSNSNINSNNNNNNSIPFKNMPLPLNQSEQENTNNVGGVSSHLVKPSSPILSNSPITQHNDALLSPTNCPATSPHQQQTNFLINNFKQVFICLFRYFGKRERFVDFTITSPNKY